MSTNLGLTAHLETQRRVLAYLIRSELVCCDSYDRHRPRTHDAPDPEDHPDFHAICYWGEAAARLVEGRVDEEDACDHAAGSFFDRTICAAPCGKMHDRCRDCGDPFDECMFRSATYFNGISVTHVIIDEAQDVPGDFFEEDESVADVVAAELQQLRAEVQRLRGENDDLRDAMRHGMGLD